MAIVFKGQILQLGEGETAEFFECLGGGYFVRKFLEGSLNYEDVYCTFPHVTIQYYDGILEELSLENKFSKRTSPDQASTSQYR